MALDFAMTSGMRNEPPISTSSPRETMTSPPSASVLRARRTAAALLFTTIVEKALSVGRTSPPVQPRVARQPPPKVASERADQREYRAYRARRFQYRIRGWSRHLQSREY